MTVPYAFANLSGNIALAKLDSNFNTPITIGNTSVLLGNTVTTLNNLTLANVTITSGTGANISLTSPLAVSSGGTGIANLTVNNVLIGNGTNAITSVAPGTTGNVLTSIGGVWVSNVAVTSAAAGANTQVQYNSANLLAGSANLTFDGTNLGLAGGTANGVAYLNGSKVLTTGSALTFDSSGNLGLGVTPSAWQSDSKALDIGAYTSVSNVLGYQAVIANNAYYNSGYRYRTSGYVASAFVQASGAFQWFQTSTSGTAGNAITFTQAMTLDASGNLIVGNTSASNVGATGGVVDVPNSGASYNLIGHTSGTASGSAYQYFYYNSNNIGSITQSGTTAVLFNVTSDQRLKENIVNAPEFGSVIDSIKVRSFDWKTDNTHQRAGFVAQELVTVAPEAVHQPADPDEMMAVDYSKLVPMLVKEIQSLRIRIAQLEAQ